MPIRLPPIRQHPPRIRRARAGMSMVEVMIALMVLAVAMMGALTQIGTLHSVRTATGRAIAQQAVLRGMTERIQCLQSADVARIGTWSQHHVPPIPGAALDNDPSSNYLTVDDLRRESFIAGPFPLDQVRVYIEYFRAVTARDKDDLLIPGKAGGVFEGGAYSELYRLPTVTGLSDWLSANEIGPNDVVAVRITMMWTDGPIPPGRTFSQERRVMSLVTGRLP